MRNRALYVAPLTVLLGCLSASGPGVAGKIPGSGLELAKLDSPAPRVREYWISAEPVSWNVAPNADEVTGEEIPEEESTFTAIRLVGYNADFGRAMPVEPLMGLAGPVIEADVGDKIVIHFRNQDTHYNQPHSLHLHGVHYKDAMDGAFMASDPDKPGTAVKVGESFTYDYLAGEDSVGVWPYHDHSVDGIRNATLGMFGAVRIHGPNEGKVDREFYLFMTGLDQEFTGLKRDFDVFNGMAFMGNTPHFHAKLGERVRFNVIGLGTEFHSFHIHGHRWLNEGRYEDTRLVGPATAWSVEIVADEPGMWHYHCHVDEHMANGMMGMFMVSK